MNDSDQQSAVSNQRVFHVCVECGPIHVDNCSTCFGYGLKLGTHIPIAAGEVSTLRGCTPCPECSGDLENEHLYVLWDAARQSPAGINIKIESVQGSSELSKKHSAWLRKNVEVKDEQ